MDSCVGLAPTNDRVAAGRFGFFSLQEEWCGALVTLQAGVMLDCFTDSLGSLPNYRRKIGCRDGIRTRECQVMSLVT